MKVVLLLCLVAAFTTVNSYNRFMGTNVNVPRVYHQRIYYSANMYTKRIENLYYVLPYNPVFIGRSIKGILAYDLAHSKASVNVTLGGLGYNFVNLRMKSARSKSIHYDVYIYA